MKVSTALRCAKPGETVWIAADPGATIAYAQRAIAAYAIRAGLAVSQQGYYAVPATARSGDAVAVLVRVTVTEKERVA